MSSGNPEQERARAFRLKWLPMNIKRLVQLPPSQMEVELSAAFAVEEVALAVEAERAECAKAMCQECWKGELPIEYIEVLGLCAHRLPEWPKFDRVPCDARAIHERGRR